MDNKNLIIVLLAAVCLVMLGIFAGSALTGNTSDNMRNQTNDTINITLNNTNDTNISTTENTVSKKKNTETKKESSSSDDSEYEIHKSYFTVSENEKGQNEGMEPGRYVETWSEREGPISLEKIS